MPRSPRARISSLRRQLGVPRAAYLAAVGRQERRAHAKLVDPRPLRDLHEKLRTALGALTDPDDRRVDERPEVDLDDRPNPALLDRAEDMVRDDRLIAFYLEDNPFEARRPMAHGTTHEDLLRSWMHSPDGKDMVARLERAFADGLGKVETEVSERTHG